MEAVLTALGARGEVPGRGQLRRVVASGGIFGLARLEQGHGELVALAPSGFSIGDPHAVECFGCPGQAWRLVPALCAGGSAALVCRVFLSSFIFPGLWAGLCLKVPVGER